MKAACVNAVVNWIRAVETLPPENKMTLYKLFVTAFTESYKIVNSGIILGDLKEFADKGVVPDYVVNFMHKQVYPHLVFVNRHVEKRIIL